MSSPACRLSKLMKTRTMHLVKAGVFYTAHNQLIGILFWAADWDNSPDCLSYRSRCLTNRLKASINGSSICTGVKIQVIFLSVFLSFGHPLTGSWFAGQRKPGYFHGNKNRRGDEGTLSDHFGGDREGSSQEQEDCKIAALVAEGKRFYLSAFIFHPQVILPV